MRTQEMSQEFRALVHSVYERRVMTRNMRRSYQHLPPYLWRLLIYRVVVHGFQYIVRIHRFQAPNERSAAAGGVARDFYFIRHNSSLNLYPEHANRSLHRA
jgi:hypothetical protein